MNMDDVRFPDNSYLEFLPKLFLKKGATHQIIGPSRFIFALIVARNIEDHIIWIRQERFNPSLYPDGIASWTDVNKFVFIAVTSELEALWVAEEFLKSRTSKLILCELDKPIHYSSLRR